MKTFDQYEFAGILAPGTVALVGAAFVFPAVAGDLTSLIGPGAIIIFLILAYVAGHLVQAVGNALEYTWRLATGGRPSDWPRQGKAGIISAEQAERLNKIINKDFHINAKSLAEIGEDTWRGLVREMYAAIAAHNRAQRIDVFNGNYGLNRGIAAALLVLALEILLSNWHNWPSAALAILGTVIALARMHRFSKYYAKELFVQFLNNDLRPLPR